MNPSSALVLVVEDEPDIATILENFLKKQGYRTERAADGETALALFRASHPDLVLLDIMLPKKDGIEVLKTIRREKQTPVIMLTARTEEIDKLLGLELGADDYVSKPFRPMEVMARVKAVLRRSYASTPFTELLRLGGIELDTLQTTVRVNGISLELTATEFRLLQHFMMYPGRTFSRADLLEATMPESSALERVIDVHIANLRRKLSELASGEFIQNIRGIGFRLKP
ncbi:MAG: response regulator transcription factor [Trueperaceae bacterium]|nr:response regulator transcription factor [Trueperaceae bacterium]